MRRKKLYFGLGTAIVLFGTWLIKKRRSPDNNNNDWNSWSVGEEDVWP